MISIKRFFIPLFFFLLSLFAGLSLNAQVDQHLIIGVSVGVGLPQQNFGKSDSVGHKDTTKLKGWATTGFSFTVRAGWKFTRYFGLMAQAGGSVNWVNTSAYENQVFSNPILQNSVAMNATAHYIG